MCWEKLFLSAQTLVRLNQRVFYQHDAGNIGCYESIFLLKLKTCFKNVLSFFLKKKLYLNDSFFLEMTHKISNLFFQSWLFWLISHWTNQWLMVKLIEMYWIEQLLNWYFELKFLIDCIMKHFRKIYLILKSSGQI